MALYAIGDLHFSGEPPAKPMDVFGDHWQDHRARVVQHWTETVKPDDWVVLCGDLSWGMRLDEALPDLEAIAALPGHKVIVEGNHDYWWSSVKKMTEATSGAFLFLRNSFAAVNTTQGPVGLCGSRGWLLETCENFDPDKDKKILEHELLRVRASPRRSPDGWADRAGAGPALSAFLPGRRSIPVCGPHCRIRRAALCFRTHSRRGRSRNGLSGRAGRLPVPAGLVRHERFLRRSK
jgi:predicted phosphohydrolase